MSLIYKNTLIGVLLLVGILFLIGYSCKKSQVVLEEDAIGGMPSDGQNIVYIRLQKVQTGGLLDDWASFTVDQKSEGYEIVIAGSFIVDVGGTYPKRFINTVIEGDFIKQGNSLSIMGFDGLNLEIPRESTRDPYKPKIGSRIPINEELYEVVNVDLTPPTGQRTAAPGQPRQPGRSGPPTTTTVQSPGLKAYAYRNEEFNNDDRIEVNKENRADENFIYLPTGEMFVGFKVSDEDGSPKYGLSQDFFDKIVVEINGNKEKDLMVEPVFLDGQYFLKIDSNKFSIGVENEVKFLYDPGLIFPYQDISVNPAYGVRLNSLKVMLNMYHQATGIIDFQLLQDGLHGATEPSTDCTVFTFYEKAGYYHPERQACISGDDYRNVPNEALIPSGSKIYMFVQMRYVLNGKKINYRTEDIFLKTKQ